METCFVYHICLISAAVYVTSELFWDFELRRLLVCYRRFWTTYRSHLQGSSTNYSSTLRKIPEDRGYLYHISFFNLLKSPTNCRPCEVLKVEWHRKLISPESDSLPLTDSFIHSFIHSIGMWRLRWFLAFLKSFFQSSLLYTPFVPPFTPTSSLSWWWYFFYTNFMIPNITTV